MANKENEEGEDVERRLVLVSERLERASTELQELVDQLRESFRQSDGSASQEIEDLGR